MGVMRRGREAPGGYVFPAGSQFGAGLPTPPKRPTEGLPFCRSQKFGQNDAGQNDDES